MNRWKLAAIIQGISIVALLGGGALWIEEDRKHTRASTLHALYDYLAPPQQDNGRLLVPVVLDLGYDKNGSRYTVNGKAMDLAQLREFTKLPVFDSEGNCDPLIVRPTPETPFPKIMSTLRFLAENRVKLFSLAMEHEVWLLTDRNLSKSDDLLLMPDQAVRIGGGEKL